MSSDALASLINKLFDFYSPYVKRMRVDLWTPAVISIEYVPLGDDFDTSKFAEQLPVPARPLFAPGTDEFLEGFISLTEVQAAPDFFELFARLDSAWNNRRLDRFWEADLVWIRFYTRNVGAIVVNAVDSFSEPDVRMEELWSENPTLTWARSNPDNNERMWWFGNAVELTEKIHWLLAEYSRMDALLHTEFARREADEHYRAGDQIYYVRHNQPRHDEAIAEFTKCLEKWPGHAEALYMRGMCFRDDSRFDEAISDFSEAIRLAPDNLFTAYELASAYDQRGLLPQHAKPGDCEAAETWYSKVIDLGPRVADRSDRDDDSMQTMVRTIGQAHHSRGVLRYLRHDTQNAVADLTRSIEIAQDGDSYLYRSHCYERLGESEKAKADLEKHDEYFRIKRQN